MIPLALSYLDDMLCHDTTPQGDAEAHMRTQAYIRGVTGREKVIHGLYMEDTGIDDEGRGRSVHFVEKRHVSSLPSPQKTAAAPPWRPAFRPAGRFLASAAPHTMKQTSFACDVTPPNPNRQLNDAAAYFRRALHEHTNQVSRYASHLNLAQTPHRFLEDMAPALA